MTVSSEATCAACGRYQGPDLSCPYCGWIADDAVPRRRLRLASGVLALVGLALLYAMARFQTRDPVRIGSIGPRMQYASVKVRGTVTRRPYVSQQGSGDYISLLIDDGSGSLRASAKGTVAGVLIAGDRLPSKGQEVEVDGRLSVSADGSRKLRILRPDALVRYPVITPPPAREPG